MVFKRKNPRSWSQTLTESVYPRGGWWRAGTYMFHRMRRLPDQPHRIARGVAVGVFVCFTPFFGLHFASAAALAWVMRGNILAALLATFVGNPLTFPLIAWSSTVIGRWMLGVEGHLSPRTIVNDFAIAIEEFWHNVIATFTPSPSRWHGLEQFFHDIYLPYLLGGILPGIAAAVLAHYLTLPVLSAHQKRRSKKLAERAEKRRERRARDAEAMAQAMSSRESTAPVEDTPDPR